MTEETTSPTSDAPGPAHRARKWRWAIFAGAVGLLCWWWFNRRPTMRLPGGEVVVVERVTFGKMHESQPPALARLAHRFWGRPLRGTSESTESDSIGVWLECRSRWTRRPRNFEGVHNVVLIDRDGWPHTMMDWFEEYERTRNGSYRSTGQPVKLENLASGSDVVTYAVFPPVRPRGDRLAIGLIDGEGQVLATTEVGYPGPIPAESTWTPDELPAARTDGDLSVTLQSVHFLPPSPAPEDSPSPLRGIRVVPEFEVRWKDQPCADCCTQTDTNWLGALYGPLFGDPQQIMDNSSCTLSPFEPAWEWRHTFYPGPTADFDAEDVWDAGEIVIPPAGERVAVAKRGTIHDLEYGIESVGGPGDHTISVDIGQRIKLHNRGSAEAGYRVTARQMPPNVTVAQYEITSEIPFLIVTSPAIVIEDKTMLTPAFHIVLRDSSGEVIQSTLHELSWFQWTHNMPNGVDHPHEYWVVFPAKDHRDLSQVHVTIAQYRMREFSFYIRPPGLDVYREFGCLPSTVRIPGNRDMPQ